MDRYNSTLLAWPKRRLYFVFLAVTATMASFTFAPGLWREWRIAQAPVAAVGVVTGLDCPNHGHVDYTFEVAGATLPGASRYIDGAPCPSLRLGDRVNVSFEQNAPEYNVAFAANNNDSDRVAKDLRNGLVTTVLFVFAGPLWLVFVAKVFLRLSAWLPPRRRLLI